MPKYYVTLDISLEAEVEAPTEEAAQLKVEQDFLAECSDEICVELLEEDEEDE